MAEGHDDTIFNIGCMVILFIGVLSLLGSIWSKSPFLIILLIIAVIVGIVAKVFHTKFERDRLFKKVDDNLENYDNYRDLIAYENLRAFRLENEMKESELKLAALERRSRLRSELSQSALKEIEVETKREELSYMKLKYKYESLKNKIREMENEDD